MYNELNFRREETPYIVSEEDILSFLARMILDIVMLLRFSMLELLQMLRKMLVQNQMQWNSGAIRIWPEVGKIPKT